MFWSLNIGSIAGTQVRVHITFLLFLGWIFAASWVSEGSQAAWAGLAFMVLLFACVLAHEFGHIFTARAFGVATPDVTLLPIGGLARLERIPEKPQEEFLIAIAGPLVNVAIAFGLVLVAGAHLKMADLATVEKTRDATLKTFGKIDILVNNAGIAGVNRTVWETELDEWRKVLRINLDGPFICCKAIVPDMIRQKYGRIVNIASIAGKEGNANAAHYSASKAGLIALTKSLGKELAGYEIAVNAVTPAAARTAIFEQMTQQHIDFMLSKIPKGRFVLVEELAAMVAWLASEDCAFSTGAVFDISGGRATY